MDHKSFFCLAAALAFPALACFVSLAGAQQLGLTFGFDGDNLPSPGMAVLLCESRNVTFVRLFEPSPLTLNSIRGKDIAVVLGVANKDLQPIAASQEFADMWVSLYVVPYFADIFFCYIAVGNEAIPGDLAAYVLPAMKNIQASLRSGLLRMPVTTVLSSAVLGVSYPPSRGAFTNESATYLAPILDFLDSTRTPLLVNVYPYFACASDATIRRDYALFTTNEVVVVDGSLGYRNLFDAMLDGLYSALERAGHPDVMVVVSETGWPSSGNGELTTIQNAKTYNNNVLKHAASGKGTPKRPGIPIGVYLFNVFDENLKSPGVDQHFGIFNPDLTDKYHVKFPARLIRD